MAQSGRSFAAISSLFFVILGCLAVISPVPAASFSVGAEIGAGVKHNDEGEGLFVRAVVLGEKGGGCGVIAGTWNGEFENDVVGLTCEKRFTSANDTKPGVSVGLGAVDLTPSKIVNSDWALELHLRFFVTRHTALAFTHFSNAGSANPNRGFNFLSFEMVF